MNRDAAIIAGAVAVVVGLDIASIMLRGRWPRVSATWSAAWALALTAGAGAAFAWGERWFGAYLMAGAAVNVVWAWRRWPRRGAR